MTFNCALFSVQVITTKKKLKKKKKKNAARATVARRESETFIYQSMNTVFSILFCFSLVYIDMAHPFSRETKKPQTNLGSYDEGLTLKTTAFQSFCSSKLTTLNSVDELI